LTVPAVALTEDAVVVCSHELGRVAVDPTQALVTIDGRRILVERDPVARPITGCPNVGATIRPCVRTVDVSTGLAEHVHVDGRRVCLATVSGATDGTPPGVTTYRVREPGQTLVTVWDE
jgi:hypothetical protein